MTSVPVKKKVKPTSSRRKLRNPSYRSKFFRFPEKLFKVVNDGIVITWNENGTGIVIEEDIFEAHVMDLYPGFVQVGTFHNLRRLLRDYGFDFIVIRKRRQKTPTVALKIEYRHPLFTRNASMLDLYKIVKIKTDSDLESRKNILATFSNEREGVKASGCVKYKLKRYHKCRMRLIQKFYKNNRSTFEHSGNTSLDDSLISEIDFERLGLDGDTSFFLNDNTPIRQSQGTESGYFSDQSTLLTESSLHVLQMYGRRELDDVDFAELMYKQLPEYRQQVTLQQWDTNLHRVNELVSTDLLPSPHTAMYVPINFEDL